MGQQVPDLLPIKGDRSSGIEPVQLRTEIERVNAWVVSLDIEEVMPVEENIEFGDEFSFQGGHCNPDSLFRANEGPGFQQNDPVLARDVIAVDWNMVAGDLALEDSHRMLSGFVVIKGAAR